MSGERKPNALMKLAKHSGVYAAGNMLSRIASFLMLPLYTAYLTPFDYGVLDLIETTSGMIALVAGFGMAAALGRFYFDYDTAQERNAVVSTTFMLAGVSALVVALVAIPLSGPLSHVLFSAPVDSLAFRLGFWTVALGLVTDLALIYLRTVNRSIIFVVASFASLVIGVGLNIYLIVVQKMGIYGILVSNIVTKALVGLPIVVWIMWTVGMRFDRKVAKGMYRYGLPLMPSEIASVAISYSDRYFINGFLSTAEAGIYGMAQKLGTALHYLITSPFLMAFVTQRFEIGRASNAPQVLASAFRYHMAVLIVPSAALALLAPEILDVMTAPEFHGAAGIMPFAALSMVLLATKYHFEYGILREKATHWHMYINTGSAILHMLLNLVLIRTIGLWGAIVAVLAAYTAKSVSYYAVSQRFFVIPYPVRQCLALLLAVAAVVFVGLEFAPAGWLGLAFKALLLLALLAAPFVTRVLSRADLVQAQALVQRVLGRGATRA